MVVAVVVVVETFFAVKSYVMLNAGEWAHIYVSNICKFIYIYIYINICNKLNIFSWYTTCASYLVSFQ